MDRSIINSSRYQGGSHHLILVDAILVMVYVWFVLPHQHPSNNKFTGMKEITRQLTMKELEEPEGVGSDMCECGVGDQSKIIASLRRELVQKDAEINRLMQERQTANMK